MHIASAGSGVVFESQYPHDAERFSLVTPDDGVQWVDGSVYPLLPLREPTDIVTPVETGVDNTRDRASAEMVRSHGGAFTPGSDALQNLVLIMTGGAPSLRQEGDFEAGTHPPQHPGYQPERDAVRRPRLTLAVAALTLLTACTGDSPSPGAEETVMTTPIPVAEQQMRTLLDETVTRFGPAPEDLAIDPFTRIACEVPGFPDDSVTLGIAAVIFTVPGEAKRLSDAAIANLVSEGWDNNPGPLGGGRLGRDDVDYGLIVRDDSPDQVTVQVFSACLGP